MTSKFLCLINSYNNLSEKIFMWNIRLSGALPRFENLLASLTCSHILSKWKIAIRLGSCSFTRDSSLKIKALLTIIFRTVLVGNLWLLCKQNNFHGTIQGPLYVHLTIARAYFRSSNTLGTDSCLLSASVCFAAYKINFFQLTTNIFHNI